MPIRPSLHLMFEYLLKNRAYRGMVLIWDTPQRGAIGVCVNRRVRCAFVTSAPPVAGVCGALSEEDADHTVFLGGFAVGAR